ncbi:unnamed protein product [Paramecium pentaurelia]|uniref:Uncharacterized protein n=1 Tax=Paramecium pentaurelia TaxID=43138 RepID=A0A8S1YEZ5_9CILI|nr:unnamed protein product [Paramecium pentaurelia]
MKKQKASSSVDCIYMETMLNQQIRSNIRMIQNKQINLPQTPKLMSQNQSQRIVKITKESQQSMIQIQDNKILMSQLFQPMIIHSHRIVQSNKQSTLESPKLKRYCLNLDNHHQNIIKQQNFQKKVEQIQQFQKETKLCYPYKRIKRKHKLLTSFIDQKQNQNSQNYLIHFKSMADLTGWQINEDPQIEMQ